MENCNYVFVKDDEKTDENPVITITDNYANSDICEFCTPVAEVACPNYKIVEPEKDLSKDTYHEVNYNTVSYNL